MIKLNVWLTQPNGETIQAGELVVSDPDNQGRLQGQYRYHPNYLNSPIAFPLDPVHLPLSSRIFDASRPASGVHGVFEDSLPDAWGRTLMIRRHRLDRDKQRVPHLLQLLGGHGLGALSYSVKEIVARDVGGLAESDLAELQRQARQFEEDPDTLDDEISLLFQAGSSPGGARPKALIRDGETSYIAKFPSIGDQFNVVALEAATMQLSKLAGIDTATTRHISCAAGDVLLVKRFDLNALGGCNHIISMQTLLKADGYYTASYHDMAQIIRQISGNPTDDLMKLFQQLVFNVLIGNTDDHLKNFCMLYDGRGYRLSPAFDLLPNIGGNREHVLFINFSCLPPSRKALLEEAKRFGIKRERQAGKIIDSIVEVVGEWQSVFRESNVPDEDIQRLDRDIYSRINQSVQGTRYL